MKECTVAGGCVEKTRGIVLDANWRWTHIDGKNCFDESGWTDACDGPEDCAQRCVLEGLTEDNYRDTYGITTAGDRLTMKFATKHPYGTNIGGRVYLLDDDDETYLLMNLKNRELSITVDDSQLVCGQNGAVYFVEMEADGGKASFADNDAGAEFGTGYCDAQCPHDIKYISGEANRESWNSDTRDITSGSGDDYGGKYGVCCAELDIWEANALATAYTPHPCSTDGVVRCDDLDPSLPDCGDNWRGNRYDGVCDKDGCDYQPYRLGETEFFGPRTAMAIDKDGTQYGGDDFAVDTSQPVTVVTQFITDDGTDDGDLVEIRRLYVQNGEVIANPSVRIGGKDFDSITDEFCAASKGPDMFAEPENDYEAKGAMRRMGEQSEAMVLVLSLWDDFSVNMRWLDSFMARDAGRTEEKGVKRGPCVADPSLSTADLYEARRDSPAFQPGTGSEVTFSDIRFGEIGSTFDAGAARPTPGPSTPTPPPTPKKGTGEGDYTPPPIFDADGWSCAGQGLDCPSGSSAFGGGGDSGDAKTHTYACADWSVGSRLWENQECAFRARTGSDVTFGVGSFGEGSGSLGKCFQLAVEGMDAPLVAQVVNTGSDVRQGQFDLQQMAGGVGACNALTSHLGFPDGSSTSGLAKFPMFAGDNQAWGPKAFGGFDDASGCDGIPEFPDGVAPVSPSFANGEMNLREMCRAAFARGTRASGGANPRISSGFRVPCPKEIFEATGLRLSSDSSFSDPERFTSGSLTRMWDGCKPSASWTGNVKGADPDFKAAVPCGADGITRVHVESTPVTAAADLQVCGDAQPRPPTSRNTPRPTPRPTPSLRPPTGKPSARPTASGSSGDCAGEWAQCGGEGWSGSTCCQPGLKCEPQHRWYSQCLPGDGSEPTNKPTSKPTTKLTSKPTSKPTTKLTSKPTTKPTSTSTLPPSPTRPPTLSPSFPPTRDFEKCADEGEVCNCHGFVRFGDGSVWTDEHFSWFGEMCVQDRFNGNRFPEGDGSKKYFCQCASAEGTKRPSAATTTLPPSAEPTSKPSARTTLVPTAGEEEETGCAALGKKKACKQSKLGCKWAKGRCEAKEADTSPPPTQAPECSELRKKKLCVKRKDECEWKKQGKKKKCVAKDEPVDEPEPVNCAGFKKKKGCSRAGPCEWSKKKCRAAAAAPGSDTNAEER